MPVVNGKLTAVDLVEQAQSSCAIDLVDQFGAPVRGFKSSTNEAIFGTKTVPLTAGAYSVTLTDNAAITPANTMYRRRWFLPGAVTQDDYFVVPTGGGPYQEAALAINLTPLPTPPASNLVQSFSLGATTGNIAVSGLTLEPVPGMVITIPDLTRPVVVYGSITLAHQTVATSILYAGLEVVGNNSITAAKGVGTQFGGAAGDSNGVSVQFQAILAAHSAGNYQAGVNAASGNVHVIGGGNGITTLVALAV